MYNVRYKIICNNNYVYIEYTKAYIVHSTPTYFGESIYHNINCVYILKVKVQFSI